MPGRNVEWIYFQGKCSWEKVTAPDVEYKNWNIKVHLTPESVTLFNELKENDGEVSGILNELKRDDDGDYAVFKRPMVKTWEGKDTMLTPPEVIDAEGKPYHGRIGNGSDVTVKVECYKYNKPFKKGRGKAIRMVAVKIDNLVPYERSKDYTAAQEHAIKGLDEVKPQTW